MRGIGAGRRRTGAPERGSVRAFEVRGGRRRRLKSFVNMIASYDISS
jgi:hypothetical protein